MKVFYFWMINEINKILFYETNNIIYFPLNMKNLLYLSLLLTELLFKALMNDIYTFPYIL